MSLKQLHDGRSLCLERAISGLVLSADLFHTVVITACFLFKPATGVLVQLRHGTTSKGRESEAWDDLETEPFGT